MLRRIFDHILDQGLPLVLGIAALVISLGDNLFFQIDFSPTSQEFENIIKFELAVLGVLSLFAYWETRRLHLIDDTVDTLETLEKRTEKLDLLDIEGSQRAILMERFGGVTDLHDKLSDTTLTQSIRNARKVRILQTFIPNIDELHAPLLASLEDGAIVEILLVNPTHDVARLRALALSGSTANTKDAERVANRVRDNLTVLAGIYDSIEHQLRGNLKVRVYGTLPSVCIHQADDVYWIGFFFHGELATNTPQFEIRTPNSNLSLVTKLNAEFERLWDSTRDLDLSNWQKDLKSEEN